MVHTCIRVPLVSDKYFAFGNLQLLTRGGWIIDRRIRALSATLPIPPSTIHHQPSTNHHPPPSSTKHQTARWLLPDHHGSCSWLMVHVFGSLTLNVSSIPLCSLCDGVQVLHLSLAQGANNARLPSHKLPPPPLTTTVHPYSILYLLLFDVEANRGPSAHRGHPSHSSHRTH